MSDAAINNITKMKVVELRKELKSRGLSYAGDKGELVARLQAATTNDDNADINLDSDEIDSDGVLSPTETMYKSQNDILDDFAVDTINEELVLEEHSPTKTVIESKPPRILKRKLATDTTNDKETKEGGAKKIVLNRTPSISSSVPKPSEAEPTNHEPEINPSTISSNNKVKITSDMDTKTRLEMRAKRFGLPVKVSEADRKEARKQRFNQKDAVTTTVKSSSLSENIEKLKKRSERFGQSVSSIMTVIENKEKLEKRKEKFNAVK